MRKPIAALLGLALFIEPAIAAEDWTSKLEARPYLASECMLTSNPVRAKPKTEFAFLPLLLGALVPKAVDFVLSSVIKAIDSASDAEVNKKSGDIYFNFFVPSANYAVLRPQPYFKCLTVVVGNFATSQDDTRKFATRPAGVMSYPEGTKLTDQLPDDLIVARLQQYGVPLNIKVPNGFGTQSAAIASIYEIELANSDDNTAFRAFSRYHVVHRHIGDAKKSRAVALSISINGPGVEADSQTLAHVLLNRQKLAPKTATNWDDFKVKKVDAYASGWVTSVAASKEVLAAFAAARAEYVRKKSSQVKEFMPVRLNVQLIETGDELKMGKFVAKVLNEIKPKVAEQVVGALLPKEVDVAGAKTAACKAQIDLLEAKAKQVGADAMATPEAKALAAIKVDSAQRAFDDASAILAAANFAPENGKTYCS